MRTLGPSESAVLNWLRMRPWSTAAQVGEALYATTSSCAGPAYGPRHWSIEKCAKAWAGKLLARLVKRGLVDRRGLASRPGHPTYAVRDKREEEAQP